MKVWQSLPMALALLAGCSPRPASPVRLETAVAATLTALPTWTLRPTIPPEPSPFPTKPIFTESFALQLDPGRVATLTYTDLGISTQLEFPPNSTTYPVTVSLIAELASSPDPGLSPTGHAFVLLVSPADQIDKGYAFQMPVIITTTYEEGALISEVSVQLLWWSGEDWRDPGSNCTPAAKSIWHPDTNTIQASTCLPGTFAIFTAP